MFVIGQSDRAVIPLLIRKLGYQGAIHPVLIEQDEAYRPEAILKHLDSLLQRQPRVSKIIICVDSECTDVEESRRQGTETEAKLREKGPRVPIRYVVVDHCLEGWLLHDQDAIRSVLGTHSGLSLPGNPENECRLADLMRKLFATHRSTKPFKKTKDDKKIAAKLDIQVLQSSSPTFREFVAALRDP